MPPLLLYMTVGCHLCEQAQQAIQQALGCVAPEQDIADDDQLVGRYGVLIPVLARTDSGAELHWPFTALQVRELVQAAGAAGSDA